MYGVILDKIDYEPKLIIRDLDFLGDYFPHLTPWNVGGFWGGHGVELWQSQVRNQIDNVLYHKLIANVLYHKMIANVLYHKMIANLLCQQK